MNSGTLPIGALRLAAQMIPHFEGFRARPYWDSLGKCWSIGYGFCTLADGSTVEPKTPALSLLECQELLREKLAEDYMPDVVRRLKGTPVSDGQLAALTSFAWNLGASRVTEAGLPGLLAQGKLADAAKAMQRYNRARDGSVPGGLVTRRAEEAAVLLGAGWPLPAEHPLPQARENGGSEVLSPTEALNQQWLERAKSMRE